MAGAIAGTAILYGPQEKTSRLHTVTLTINNICDGECPHCYLQYEGRKGILSEENAEKILNSDFNHLAIVGKEPCLSPDMVEFLAKENSKRGRKTSIVTSGISLDKLSKEALTSLNYIDVSFDGGPDTYRKRRGLDFKKVITNLEEASKYLAKTNFNALHTIYRENLDSLDDMMQVQEAFSFGKIAFSIYKVPYNQGSISVSRASLMKEVIPVLAGSSAFRDSPRSVLLVSSADLTSANEDDFLSEVNRQGLEDKVRYIDNPLDYGFIRVTYDGKVLTPYDAIHTVLYDVKGFSLNDFKSLNEIVEQMHREK